MSVSVEPKRTKRWLWPAAFLVAFAISIIISGLAGNDAPNGLVLIKSPSEYEGTLKKATDLWKVEMEKTDANQPLTADDMVKLREANRLFDSLSLYNPTKMGPYFAAGKIHLALGENEEAARSFRQAIDNAIQSSSETAASVKQLTADSEFGLAAAMVNENQFDAALSPINDAVATFKDRGDYRYLRARIYIQQKKLPEAIKDLRTAVEINPLDQKATSLLHFVESASPNTPVSKGAGS